MGKKSKEYYDVYSFTVKEKSLNENFLKSKIRDKWNEIFNNHRKKKEFKERFIKFVKDEILNKYPFTLQCKLLKIYECYEKQLENFAKNELKRNHYPEVPTAKEIYKKLFLQNNNKINLKEDLKAFISEDFLKFVNIADSSNENFPYYSVLIKIKFKLKKPYLSKDDDDFYIIDNPIVKDKVFKLPMVRATTWKGALRFATIKVFEDWIYVNESKLDKETVFKKRARIVKLFGNEKDSQEDYLGKLCLLAIEGKLPTGNELKKKIEDINKEFEKWLVKNGIISKEIPSRSGRLFFYPTFFDEISLDVITPLNRETKTPIKGRGPIYFEIVPEDAEGIFRLLYYPFDLIAKGELGRIEDELKEDMKLLAKAIRKVLCEIGFSAKKTSGYGVGEIVSIDVRCGNKLKQYEYKIKKFFKGEDDDC